MPFPVVGAPETAMGIVALMCRNGTRTMAMELLPSEAAGERHLLLFPHPGGLKGVI